MKCILTTFCTLFATSLLLLAEKPNVIFILADDLGYGDLGCNGQKKIRTPNIDSIASTGMRFTSHYSGQTVCTPSRASLMYGQHMGHCPIKSNSGESPSKGDFLLPQLFKNAGYKTGIIGKWGLMGKSWNDEKFQADYYPNNCGFDYWCGFESQGYAHFYYPSRLLENKKFIHFPENEGIRSEGLYSPGKGTHAHDTFISKAEGFIQTNKDAPFFLYIPFAIPHAELAVPADCKHLAYYKSLNWPEIPKPEGGGGGAYGSPYKKGYSACTHPHATYAAMISRMDDSVGRIQKLLKQLKLDQNTLLIFSSDNGPSPEGGQSLRFFESAGEFRGFKRSIYEGGTRVPLLVSWPNKIKAATVSNHLSGFNDHMPTLAAVLGSKKPSSTDGVSFAPTLLGEDKLQENTAYRYSLWMKNDAIRVGDWKIIRMKQEPVELYNLAKDPSEKSNLIKNYPEKVKQLLPFFEEATRPL